MKSVVYNCTSIILEYVTRMTILPINNRTPVEIHTVLNKPFEVVVKHIMSFVFTYHYNARVHGLFFTKKDEVIHESNDCVMESITIQFNFDQSEIDVLESKKPFTSCFRSFTINTGSKKRNIITYSDDENGKIIKSIHRKINSVLSAKYTFDNNSFAYQKGKSILSCVKQHQSSNSFIKLDIHKFFNSINKKLLVEKIFVLIFGAKAYSEQLDCIFDSCFFNDEMPIGLVTSPILSDIYLNDFDKQIVSKLGDGYTYTRYADDILISSRNTINIEEKKRIIDGISSLLHPLKLRLNTKKSVYKTLTRRGDCLRYLGLNLVKTENDVIVSVGKKYKYYIAKCFLNYAAMPNSLDTEKQKFYLGKRITGYLSFVKMIEGEQGLSKIYKRIEKSTNGRIRIKERINIPGKS